MVDAQRLHQALHLLLRHVFEELVDHLQLGVGFRGCLQQGEHRRLHSFDLFRLAGGDQRTRIRPSGNDAHARRHKAAAVRQPAHRGHEHLLRGVLAHHDLAEMALGIHQAQFIAYTNHRSITLWRPPEAFFGIASCQQRDAGHHDHLFGIHGWDRG